MAVSSFRSFLYHFLVHLRETVSFEFEKVLVNQNSWEFTLATALGTKLWSLESIWEIKFQIDKDEWIYRRFFFCSDNNLKDQRAGENKKGKICCKNLRN